MRAASLLAVIFALGPFGCPESPPQPEAEPDSPAQPAEREESDTGHVARPATHADSDSGAQTLAASPAESKIGFAVARATVGHVGHFEQFSATLELVDERPTKLEIVVKTASVAADRRGLTEHLKSADFFDVDKFPTARFTSEQITPRPDIGPEAYAVTGTMHLHGVRRKLEFEATIDVEADRVVGRATLDISAKSFGIAYEGMEAELAEDEVALETELTFPRVADP